MKVQYSLTLVEDFEPINYWTLEKKRTNMIKCLVNVMGDKRKCQVQSKTSGNT